MGSQAARLRGDLPAWSEPDLTDFDIVGSPAEFDRLSKMALAAYPQAIAHDRPNRRFALRIALSDDFSDRILVDWVSDEVESSRLLLALPDHTDGVVFGQACQVISAVTELAIKRAILPFQAAPAKTLRWIGHWAALVGDQPASSAHQAFVDQLCAEYRVSSITPVAHTAANPKS